METPEGKESLYYDSHKNFFTVELLERMIGSRFSILDVKRLEPTVGAQTPTIIVLLQKSWKERKTRVGYVFAVNGVLEIDEADVIVLWTFLLPNSP